MLQEELTSFDIEVEPLRDAVRVCPSGELDLATVDVLRAQVADLIAAGFERIVLDLGELTFFDSSGIHLILDLVQWSRSDGWQMAVLDGTAPVRRAFEVTGLHEVIPFAERHGLQTGRLWQ